MSRLDLLRAAALLLLAFAGAGAYVFWPTLLPPMQIAGERTEPGSAAGAPKPDPVVPARSMTKRTVAPEAKPTSVAELDPFATSPSRTNDLAAKGAVINASPRTPVAALERRTASKAQSQHVAARFDPDRTSWESPFDASCWHGGGWDFDSAAMQSKGAEGTATFRRAYRRLMLECRIEVLTPPGAPLRVRLVSPGTDGSVTLSINRGSITVHDDTAGPSMLVKQAGILPELQPGHPGLLRMAATGNRLIISWDGTVVLTCNQSVAHSGREFAFAFVADKARYRISDLRIEGE